MTRGADRGAFGAAALGALGAAWLLPWQGWFGAPFPAHMARHIILVAVAAPLLVLAWPAAAARAAVPPLAGAVAEFVTVWSFHLPGLHLLPTTGTGWRILEQGAFLATGLAVWAGALAPRRPLAGAGALLLTSMHMTLLGALIVLAPAPLYHAAAEGGAGLDAQRLGGLVMLGVGTPAYLLGGLWLVARALRDPAAEGHGA